MSRVSRIESSARRQLWLELAILACIVLLGAALRIYQLDGPALWADEGNNAYLSHQSLPELLRMSRLTHDTDPPAHRLALALWLAVWGDGVVPLRMLSVLCNLITIPLIWLWARRLGGPGAALTAALLFALHPMAAYFGREAKGYPFATLFVTAQSLIWGEALRLERIPAKSLWLCATLSAILALGAHYYVMLVFAAQALAHGANWRASKNGGTDRQAKRLLGWWAASMGVTALTILPWVWLTFGTAAGGALGLASAREAWSVPHFLQEVGLTLAAGPVPRNIYRLPAMLALLALVAVAVWRRPRETRWTIALLVVPFGLAMPLQMAVPFFAPRFLYYVLAPLCVLAALGLQELRRRRWPILALLVLGWGLSASGIYAPLTSVPHDLRPIAQSLKAMAEPGDAVVVGYIWQEGILRSYAPDLPVSYTLGWYQPENVEQRLQPLLEQHRRLWLLSYEVPAQHASNTPGHWLEQNATRMWSTSFEAHRLSLYAPVCRADNATLRGVAWKGISMRYGVPQAGASAGDWIAVPLIWQVSERPRQPVVAFCQLIDAQGGLVAQQDGAPRNGTRLFRGMEPGEEVSECRMVQVPKDATPGVYTLQVGLYSPRTGERLYPLTGDADDDQSVIIASLMVEGIE